MCTLIILQGVSERYPLIVAANRDEFYDRPSHGPELLQVLPLAVIAPKDMRAGGTWMGAAQGGWFVGLTNQDDGVHVEEKKSRGDVVRDVLLTCDHRAAARYLAALDLNDYNSFNLVFGRPGALFLARAHRGFPIDLEPITRDITVVSNDCAGTAYQRKGQRGAELAAAVCTDDTDASLMRKLAAVLADHDIREDGPYQALCVHDEGRGFGTRSSAVVLFSASGDVTYYHSEGHPCTSTGYRFCRRLYNLVADNVVVNGRPTKGQSPT